MNLLCFSHLRWDFVYQRPQHLMSRFAKPFNVYFIEEPIFYKGADVYSLQTTKENVNVIQPHLNENNHSCKTERLKNIIDVFLKEQQIENFISWYYSPMALLFTAHLHPQLIVYDCMDELSAFKFAPPELKEAEQKLLQKADVVFTGGHSLYKAKKYLHHNIYSFPSSIDKEHFGKARNNVSDPSDQQHIPHPRLGFFGVIDERFDIDLIKQVADAKPKWQFVFIGPVVKISDDVLPKNKNIHYLGGKNYNELPNYVSGWDIALIPFALNESTKFISPTKTPEYLAAGKPVISTAIEDVVHPYGDEKLVHIIHSAEEFIDAANKELSNYSKEDWLKKSDAFLSGNSWNATWQNMFDIIQSTLDKKQTNKPRKDESLCLTI
ncbi:MAG TPA: glycosyltransferase family 1 protein [Parafilimonas sp.]|nr:glycosyltransferase family 1 protein [Parafilimonas sp.]